MALPHLSIIVFPSVPVLIVTLYTPVVSPAVLKLTVAEVVVAAPEEQPAPIAPVTGMFAPKGPVMIKSDPFATIELHCTGSEKVMLNELVLHAFVSVLIVGGVLS